MTPTARLLAAVEVENRDEVVRLLDAIPAKYWQWLTDACFRKDVNAAISLVEAMLPGWEWLINSRGNYASVWESKEVGDAHFECRSFVSPARALLIAALRALVAQEGA